MTEEKHNHEKKHEPQKEVKAEPSVAKPAEAKKETKIEVKKLEREYIIPLRREWLKVPMYERTGRAVKAIKKFIAKHMKVPDRDVKNVKLDVYFNNNLWFKGRTNPPAKIKVKAIKEGDIVKVEFVEVPEYVKFLKAKHAKLAKSLESKAEKPAKEKPTEQKEEKTAEQKVDEKEKEVATAESRAKEFEAQTKEKKHVAKLDNQKSHPVRMALKK